MRIIVEEFKVFFDIVKNFLRIRKMTWEVLDDFACSFDIIEVHILFLF
jgi:hypothetical protein